MGEERHTGLKTEDQPKINGSQIINNHFRESPGMRRCGGGGGHVVHRSAVSLRSCGWQPRGARQCYEKSKPTNR